MFLQVLNARFGPKTSLTFASWMAFCIPLMAVNLFLAWFWMLAVNWRPKKKSKIATEVSKAGFVHSLNYLRIIKPKHLSKCIQCKEGGARS